MNSFINTLSNTVLSGPLESCDLAELQRLSEMHPYSSAIQLLYARKLQAAGSAAYAEQLQKTLLYYNNPVFIKHLIEREECSPVTLVNTNLAATPPPPTPLTGKDVIETAVQPKDAAETEQDPLVAEEPEEQRTTEADEAPAVSAQVAMSAGEIHTINDGDAEMVHPEEDDATLPPLPAFRFEPIDPAKAELAFTPYHTIDYFAAQGIQLGEEQNAGDRFGTQLKSFTAWLKQMKRLPGATAKGNITLTEEKSIEQMAEQSLQGENADTEAMAQVWAKQGHAKKAIEIYKKLSLQIPAKSAYFAAKIDHLKK